ncbi:MAG: sulfotransferase [Deltaproteobacteria bacterium]|nr:sulfotransferase [Deltaproteobacteria bacterium]
MMSHQISGSMATEALSAQPVFVLGVAHCGSTLLGRMLNMHRSVFFVGELARIDRCLKGHQPCRCGEPLSRCPYWSRFLPEIESRAGYDFRRFSPDLYRRIGELCGKAFIVDTSKTRVYRMARWWVNGGEKYIFLVRDPRGALTSAVSRGNNLKRALRKNKKWTARLDRFVKKQRERGLRVYYEDLATDPESVLRSICRFLGLDFAPEMLRPADKIHHFVSGSVSPYLKDSNEIRLDERWRSALSPDEIKLIERKMTRVEVFRSRYLT